MKSIEEREKAEILYWRDSEYERPESDSIRNLINKMTDCEVFLSVIDSYSQFFNSAKTVLELGGGQGWASCTIKLLFPQLKVILTDISEYAILSKYRWERIFNVSLDNAYACKSYEIPEAPSSIDIIFCFASAHHFANLDKSMIEISRVLRSGGHCFFFYEPITTQLLYKFAYLYIVKKRPVVPEDIIVYKKLLKFAKEAGLEANVHFNPTLIKREPLETLYYFILSKLTILQRVLPCSANFHFKKP
jgi:ubiquinone/menaquinone biosynthesis C-methylase UbiE